MNFIHVIAFDVKNHQNTKGMIDENVRIAHCSKYQISQKDQRQIALRDSTQFITDFFLSSKISLGGNELQLLQT